MPENPAPLSPYARRWPIALLALAAFGALLWWQPLPPTITKGSAILVFVAILWLTEAIPITITALLVPVLATLLGVFDMKGALVEFANPILYLFLGGFTLAAALHAQGLDAHLARRIMALAGGRLWLATLLLFAVCAALSMWISNTATAAMMLPLAIGMTHDLDPERDRPTLVFVLLGVAYSASIGGIGSVVGSPPNAIAAAQMNLSFLDWMKFGLPVTLILLPCAIALLFITLRPRLNHRFETRSQPFQWHQKRLLTLAIFGATVSAWVFSVPLARALGGISQFDTLVALMAIIAVAVSGVASWREIDRSTDWGVLLLFGGGLTLSAILQKTGTSAYFAEHMAAWLTDAPLFVVLLLLAAFVVFLTELTSNTATAALLIPLFAAVAAPLGVPPVVMAVLIAVGASCAFMLPVATPPNAIVFATGHVQQREMMRAGVVLNVCFAVLLALLAYFVGDILH